MTQLQSRSSDFTMQRTEISRSAPILFAVLSALIFVAFAARFKIAGLEALRPYHFTALCVLVLISLVAVKRLVETSVFTDRTTLVVVALLGYLLIQGFLGNERSAKDAVYIAANMGSAFVVFLYLRNCVLRAKLLRTASLFVVVTVSAICGLAYLSWFFLLPFSALSEHALSRDLTVLMPLLQSPTYLARIHGIFGDPTAFGVFCAFSAVLTLQLAAGMKSQAPKAHLSLMITHLVALLGLLGSGSRMGLIALGVMLPVIAKYDCRRSLVAVGALILAIPIYSGLNVLHVNFNSALYFPERAVAPADADDERSDQSASSPEVSMRDVYARYSNETLRVTTSGAYRERGDRLLHALEEVRRTPLHGLLFGCGVECAQQRGTLSFIGYLDLLQNHGVVFLLGLGYLVLITIKRLVRGQDKLAVSSHLAIILGCLAVELFGYWLFTPFFNPVQLLFVYALASSVSPEPSTDRG